MLQELGQQAECWTIEMTTRHTEPEFSETVNAALKEAHAEFLRFLTRRTASREEAEDVLQDFYLKVVRNARTIRNRRSLRGWFAQVLRHTLADYYRKAAVKQRAHERMEILEELALTNDEAERAVCACLYRLLPALPPQYAQVIWRVDLLGQRRSQVAKSLRISANNMAVRIHRARRALRTALERFCITCPTHGFLNCGCEEAEKHAALRRRSRSATARSVMK